MMAVWCGAKLPEWGREHDETGFVHLEEDGVGEPATQRPPRHSLDDREPPRVLGGAMYRGLHLLGHLQPEPGSLILLPVARVEDVQPRERVDEQRQAQPALPNRAWSSARTSSHGIAEPGFAFKSADRRASS